MGHTLIHGGGRDRAAPSPWAGLRDEIDVVVPLPATRSQGARPPEMAFRPIPRGAFVMGSRGYSEREQPRHRVEIPDDFLLGKYVVTQREWRVVVEALASSQPGALTSTTLEASPSQFTGDGHPVEQVSGSDVRAWCAAWRAWLTRQGHARRLGISAVRPGQEAAAHVNLDRVPRYRIA